MINLFKMFEAKVPDELRKRFKPATKSSPAVIAPDVRPSRPWEKRSVNRKKATEAVRLKVLDQIQPGQETTLREIHKATGLSIKTVRGALIRLVEQKVIKDRWPDRNRPKLYSRKDQP
jgi:DNA-binding transcriptional ArsR family regulator